MKVYSLLGFVDYEGSDLVGVFSSKEKMLERLESLKREDGRYGYYDSVGYVYHELDSEIDVLGEVDYV